MLEKILILIFKNTYKNPYNIIPLSVKWQLVGVIVWDKGIIN
jgi:hypothetical protein